MGFAGELTTISLDEVFQNIATNRLSGVLNVTQRERQACILFEEGLLTAMDPGTEKGFDYEAIALYTETLEIQERTLGAGHPDTGIALFHLANLYRDTGDFETSATYFERVIEVDTNALGADHPYVADDFEEYAKLRRQMGEDDAADELQARDDAIRAKREAPDDGDGG